LKRTSDKSLFPMALGSCGHRITHQLRPINMNGRSILAVTSFNTLTAFRLDKRRRSWAPWARVEGSAKWCDAPQVVDSTARPGSIEARVEL